MSSVHHPKDGGAHSRDFRDRLGDLRQDAMELGAAGKSLAQETMRHARDTAASYLDQGRTRAQKLEKSVEDMIREHPIQAVLIAAGVGFVMAKLLSHR